MAKIIATLFGAVFILFGLASLASPTFLGGHGSPLVNLLNLLVGATVLYAAQKAGPAILFWCSLSVGAAFLGWGMVGFLLGHPGESTLNAMPPDLRLLVVLPGLVESGRNDHLLHLFFGIAFGVAAVVSATETPFRLRK